ncbi:MAG: cadherin-like domain-containing protein, partial [Bermanella sp.]
GSASDSFNLNVSAQNDAPTLGTLADADIFIAKTHTTDLSSYATDSENNSLTFSVLSCGEHLICTIDGAILSITATAGGNTTAVTTLQVDDGNGGQDSSSFNANIQPVSACADASADTPHGNDACVVHGNAASIQLNFYSGFDSSALTSAIDGNHGSTLGGQRKLSFIKAAEIIAEHVPSTVTLVIDANFSSLTCDASSAVLGSAGATSNQGYDATPPSGIAVNTFYPIGLFNALTAQDLDEALSDISAQFNANLGNTACLENSDGWYYGFTTPTTNTFHFTSVLLHEIVHGLGFASSVNTSTGVMGFGTGLNDVFSNNLHDANHGAWPTLSNAQRVGSSISAGDLLWNGDNTNGQAIANLSAGYQDNDLSNTFTVGDRVQMYAPNPSEAGSSISHFDTAVSPNELMEPFYTDGQMTLGLALSVLQDVGWGIVSSNTPPTLNAQDQTSSEDTAKVVDASAWGSDADDGDTLIYSVASACATNITCTINTDGTGLTMTPAAHHHGATHTITLNVSDGNGGSASDSFNLAISAVNDEPIWQAIGDLSLQINDSHNIELASFASDIEGDIEGDALDFSIVSCHANLSCDLSGSRLTIGAVGGAGETVAITIQADDGNGGMSDTSINIDITSNLPSTHVGVGDTQFQHGERF